MPRCLRICGAYSYRLSRRHSTIILIASFFVTMTIILQLYVHRNSEQAHPITRIGDFDYRPGSFLKGIQPNETLSYCDFNYGLPETLDWKSFRPYPSPEMGKRSPYRVIYDAVKSRDYQNISKHAAVTYATQATAEFIYHIVEIAKYWEGPISLSVFVPNYDLDITMQVMDHLCHCFPGMSKVSLHLFYPKKYPPKMRTKEEHVTTEIPTTTVNVTMEEILRKKVENYRNLNNKTRAEYIQWARKRKIATMMMSLPLKKNLTPDLQFKDCSGLDNFDIPTYRREYNMLYPINVGRNVARNASKTNYFIVSDIEMVPSDGLAPKFILMLNKLMGIKKRREGCVFAKTVFVVPLFEVERGEEIPRNKETYKWMSHMNCRYSDISFYTLALHNKHQTNITSDHINCITTRSFVINGTDRLVQLVAANRAMYFHQKVCSHCQKFPGLQSWLLRPASNIVEPMLIARREYPYHRWEPLYFGTHKEPWYSEMLSWEGRQDKMTQMLELCLQEYRLVVLDGVFLCHAAVSKAHTGVRHTRAEKINTERYMKIIAAFKNKYNDRPQCKVM